MNREDPLTRQPDRGVIGDDLSPMAPPEAYAPPGGPRTHPEEMHPFLRRFAEEHASFCEELKHFEEAIHAAQKDGITREADGGIRRFFHFFDRDFIPHSRREESSFFPLLGQRLLAAGEHGRDGEPSTAVDLMEDDHVKAVQLAAVVFNFLGLASRLPDERSRLLVLDAALEQGKSLVELLRLHIFREDNVVFPSAHRLIAAAEFDRMPASGKS